MYALRQPAFPAEEVERLRFLLEGGRALLFPSYKGTWERHDDLKSPYPARTGFYREHVLAWANDLSRSIDYLQTRSDIDAGKVAYFGFSWGSTLVQLPAVEERLKALVLVGGGLHFTTPLPEVDALNFAPHVRAPTLMINGRADYFFPPITSQAPLFAALGTANKDKKYALSDSGHIPPRQVIIRETLDWLDRYLGPPR